MDVILRRSLQSHPQLPTYNSACDHTAVRESSALSATHIVHMKNCACEFMPLATWGLPGACRLPMPSERAGSFELGGAVLPLFECGHRYATKA
jgi:hypothetical protein